MYENKTADYIYNLLIQSFQEKFNNRLRLLPKSFIIVLSKVLAGIFLIPYKLTVWFYLQLFPDTASFDEVDVLGYTLRPLVKLGNLFGVGNPTSGTAWEGTVRANVIYTGNAVMAGTQLKSEKTGCLYATSVSVMTEGESVDIPVYCTQSGIVGNLDEGDSLHFVSPIGFVQEDAEVVETVKLGVDDETEAHYRSRVLNRYSTQPQGGALADYRLWAFDVPGVLQTYPYNDEDSPGGVLLYVSGTTDLFPDRVPDSTLLRQVGHACTYDPDTGVANRKPITAILDPQGDESYPNVRAVRIITFNVYVTSFSGDGDFGSQLKTELETFFDNREPYIRGLSSDNNRSDSILRNSLISIANSVAVSMKAKFDTVTMNINGPEISEYDLGKGELAALGNLYVNGELYEG